MNNKDNMLSLVEDIKEKISDYEYKKIIEELAEMKLERPKYLLTIYQQKPCVKNKVSNDGIDSVINYIGSEENVLKIVCNLECECNKCDVCKLISEKIDKISDYNTLILQEKIKNTNIGNFCDNKYIILRHCVFSESSESYHDVDTYVSYKFVNHFEIIKFEKKNFDNDSEFLL